MRLLFLSVFFIQFLFSDTIVTEFSSLLYKETRKIENVDYLGITNYGSGFSTAAYKHYNSNKIIYIDISEIVDVYDSEGIKINYKKIRFKPKSDTSMNTLENRFDDLRNSSNGTAIALTGAGICHLLKSSIKINTIEDSSDKLKKIENLDKAEGLLILLAGITLFTNNDNNNYVSYYADPLNHNSLLNLSIKFKDRRKKI